MVETRAWSGVAQLDDVRLKAKNYAAFKLSGQMEELYPGSGKAPVTIALDCAQPPPPDVAEGLDEIAKALERLGIGFVVSVLPAVAD